MDSTDVGTLLDLRRQVCPSIRFLGLDHFFLNLRTVRNPYEVVRDRAGLLSKKKFLPHLWAENRLF